MFFLEDADLGQDHDSYNILWDKVIDQEISSYMSDFSSDLKAFKNLNMKLEISPNIKEVIWDRYCYYNLKCKMLYMEPPVNGKFLLDRHKIAACYIAAIVNVQPMTLYDCKLNKPSSYPINEYLAITVGLSVLSAFIRCSEQTSDKMFLKNGILYPPGKMVKHGEYLHNFAQELHFAFLDGSINLLSLAHELFLLEVITRTGVGEPAFG